MNRSRRSFLARGLRAGAALPLLASSGPTSIAGALSAARDSGRTMLILGGTRFLGPQVVRAARAAGYEITLFNRGRSAPDRFPDLETILGDRDQDQLDGLAGRRWDVVVDTSGYVPAHVKRSAELLAGQVGRYIFVSTVSVYRDQAVELIDEQAPLLTLDRETVDSITRIRQVGAHYGALKALCEDAAETAMPGRVVQVRPGLIVGPEDRSDRFTWWPARVDRGGEILAPGNPDGEIQFIDVRDLGDFIVRLGSEEATGPFNAVGFDGRLSMEEFLHGCKIVCGLDCEFTWASEEFLLEQEVRPYMEMPMWLPDEARGHFDVSRALAAGLQLQTVATTIRDTLRWHQATRGEDHGWRAGMKPEREAEILARWKERG